MIFGRLEDKLFFLHCRRGVMWFKSKKEMEEWVDRECPMYAIFRFNNTIEKLGEGRYGKETLKKILRSL